MQNFRHKTTSKTKKLVIVEGEMDALSVWEAQPNWDVVSVPNGAAAAKKAIQKNYEWFNYYDKIVLFPDNDEAGQKAAIEMAGVLPLGRLTSAFWRATRTPQTLSKRMTKRQYVQFATMITLCTSLTVLLTLNHYSM